jgi:hypothetical protein
LTDEEYLDAFDAFDAFDILILSILFRLSPIISCFHPAFRQEVRGDNREKKVQP